MNKASPGKRTTASSLTAMKKRGEKIAILTGYDHFAAQVLGAAGIDAILVGDTLGMTVLGYDTTLPVTMEEILHHVRAVVRGANGPLVIGDMPFGSYQAGLGDGVHNAVRMVKEGGAGAIKLEGGLEVVDTVKAIVQAGIPVMAHIGFRPQEILAQGRFRIIGRDEDAVRRLLAEAAALQEAGAFALVLESIPSEIAERITGRLAIPTIGIGAGPGCDGQVLVWHDVLGMFPRFKPSFVKRYAELHNVIEQAIRQYVEEVRTGAFPDAEHSYHLDPEAK